MASARLASDAALLCNDYICRELELIFHSARF